MLATVNASELLIALLVVVAAVAFIAERIRIAYPILLVVAGALIGFLPVIYPTMPRIQVSPELVFFIVLPPMLYYAGLMTTWRDFKANIGPISQLAVILVLLTMSCVAVVAYYTVPGMTWPTAFILGAIVAPPDAVAATSVLSKLSAPKRVVTVLEGESLVNDSTALVAYRFAIGAVTAPFVLGTALGNAFVLATGGIAVGLLAAWLLAKLLRRIEAPAVESTLALLVPYAAYLPAEKLGGSGVLAAVAAGIYMGRQLPSLGSPKTRQRILAVWDNLIFLLNGIISILIGVQLYDIVGRLPNWPSLVWCSLGVALVAILLRMIYVFTSAFATPLVLRQPLPKWREVFIISWAGMRGIVSLAAALALPMDIPPEQKDTILFVTFCVILVTLVFQGLTLAPLIKFLKLGENSDDSEAHEEKQARLDAAHAALSRLEVLGFDESINPEALNRVRAEYEDRIARLGGDSSEHLGTEASELDGAIRVVRREALHAERKMITFMRDQSMLGDEVLRHILEEIDLDEAKL
jgi:monovalent cation/hydrogen antiporter